MLCSFRIVAAMSKVSSSESGRRRIWVTRASSSRSDSESRVMYSSILMSLVSGNHRVVVH